MVRRLPLAMILAAVVVACRAAPEPVSRAEPASRVEARPPAIDHPWPHDPASTRLADRVAPPEGFVRVEAPGAASGHGYASYP
jgi:hypothetical protein